MKTGSIGFNAVALTLALALSGAVPQSAEQLYKSGLYEEEVGGNLQKAIGIFQDILKRFPESRDVAAKAQLRSDCATRSWGSRRRKRPTRRSLRIIRSGWKK